MAFIKRVTYIENSKIEEILNQRVDETTESIYIYEKGILKEIQYYDTNELLYKIDVYNKVGAKITELLYTGSALTKETDLITNKYKIFTPNANNELTKIAFYTDTDLNYRNEFYESSKLNRYSLIIYDTLNRKIEEKFYTPLSIIIKIYFYYYDLSGNLTKKIAKNPDGSLSFIEYYTNSVLSKREHFDIDNRKLLVIFYLLDGITIDYKLIYNYDDITNNIIIESKTNSDETKVFERTFYNKNWKALFFELHTFVNNETNSILQIDYFSLPSNTVIGQDSFFYTDLTDLTSYTIEEKRGINGLIYSQISIINNDVDAVKTFKYNTNNNIVEIFTYRQDTKESILYPFDYSYDVDFPFPTFLDTLSLYAITLDRFDENELLNESFLFEGDTTFERHTFFYTPTTFNLKREDKFELEELAERIYYNIDGTIDTQQFYKDNINIRTYKFHY